MKRFTKLINLLNELAAQELAKPELKEYDKVKCPECGGETVAIFTGLRDEHNKRMFYSQCCMADIK